MSSVSVGAPSRPRSFDIGRLIWPVLFVLGLVCAVLFPPALPWIAVALVFSNAVRYAALVLGGMRRVSVLVLMGVNAIATTAGLVWLVLDGLS